MAKARLVKRKEVIEQKQAALAPVPKASATSANIHSILQQHNRQSSRRPLSPREAFAALFAHLQTS